MQDFSIQRLRNKWYCTNRNNILFKDAVRCLEPLHNRPSNYIKHLVELSNFYKMLCVVPKTLKIVPFNNHLGRQLNHKRIEYRDMFSVRHKGHMSLIKKIVRGVHIGQTSQLYSPCLA